MTIVTLPVILPTIHKSKNIYAHKYFNNTNGQHLVTDLKVNLRRLKNFNCGSDETTLHLSNYYEYRDTLKIYAKNRSALHIDGDNCINCVVNVDDYNSAFSTIVYADDFDKLKKSRLYHEDLNILFTKLNIYNKLTLEIKPGDILVFDSNNYHSFDCGTGVNLLVHKFKNDVQKNTLHNPIYY